MADAGVNQYTFHIEPVNDVEDVCRKIKEHGMKVFGIPNFILLLFSLNSLSIHAKLLCWLCTVVR